MQRPQRALALFGAAVVASCAAPPPPVPAPTPAPVPVAVTSARRPSQKPARVVREIEMPVAPCVVERDRPAAGAEVGIDHVFVGSVPVAHVSELGEIRRAKLVFAEARRGVAAVDIDGASVTVRGAVPTKTGTSDDVVLYPAVPVLRAGWLAYEAIRVASVDGAALEPVTDLPSFVVPEPSFGSAPLRVPCTDLSPFAATATPAPTAALQGKRIALEDERGARLATIVDTGPKPADSPTGSVASGLPAAVLEKKGNRSKVRVELGRDLAAEGWVASRFVRAAEWNALVSRRERPRHPRLVPLTCEEEVPLWLTLRDTTFVVGAVRANATVVGSRAGTGDFRVALGSGAALAEKAPSDGTKLGATDPFVPLERMEKCREGAAGAPP